MKQAIGIDIGGTKISLGVVSEDGRVAAATRLATEPRLGFESAVKRISNAIGTAMEQAKCSIGDIAGIGIGCAGPLNPLSGVINNDYTLPSWGGCNIIEAIRGVFGVPVYLENDADAALVGEAFAGAGRGAANLVMLTFGTGVGGAVLSGGRIYRGAHGEHPEIGHVPIDPRGPACYCGRAGCLESLASGTGIGELGKAAGFADAEEVFGQALAGDARAEGIVRRVIDATATGLWTIIHTFLPERVIFGGGVMERHYGLFAGALGEVVARAKMGPSTGMQLCQATLRNEAGVVGAGFVALREGLSR